MVPAGYLASIWQMNFIVALWVGTTWAIIGATINYMLAYKLWEPIIKKLIHKYWKYIFVNETHYIKSEKYFQKHWNITTFLARFIPAIRQLISLPAWAFKMNFPKFAFYTWLWAWIWNLILMSIWYIAWENKELISKYSKEALNILIKYRWQGNIRELENTIERLIILRPTNGKIDVENLPEELKLQENYDIIKSIHPGFNLDVVVKKIELKYIKEAWNLSGMTIDAL